MKKSTTSVVIEQQSESKKRGVLAVILAVAFVAMLGIGTTYAYMKWTGNQTPNRFTADTGLEVDLVEPEWTSAVKTQTTQKYPNVASDGATIIPAAANNFSKVGTTIKKDPYVDNVSTIGNEGTAGQSAYVGMRVTFQKWVATSVGSGSGQNHKESGYYTKMSDTEAEALLNAYAFTQETTAGSAASAGTTSGSTEAGAVAEAGFYPSKDWKQINASGETAGESYQMMFLYKQGIKAEGTAISGTYTAAAAQGSDTVGTTTSTLFNTVTVIDEDALDTFIGLIKGSSTDPGWRVLIDTAAVNCKTGSESTAALTALSGNLNQLTGAFPEVREDGLSPFKNAYVTKTIDETTGAVTSVQEHGSANGSNASNVPEAYWGWEGSTTEQSWTAADGKKTYPTS